MTTNPKPTLEYLKPNHIVDGNVHTMPTSGPEHFENKDCWCEPTLSYKDEVTHTEHWVHKGYEELEQ